MRDGFADDDFDDVVVVVAVTTGCLAVVVLGVTAEISGAGMLANIEDVVMGTAGPSLSANGDPAWVDLIGLLIW
jgi:hypothetical protein